MSRKRQAFVLLAAAVSVCQMVVAVLLAGSKCGDECEVAQGETPRPRGVQWWQDENAWQWSGQAILAAVDLVVVLAACGLYARGREREARVATPAGGILFAMWALAVQPALTHAL
jgi:hypothetical protein